MEDVPALPNYLRMLRDCDVIRPIIFIEIVTR